MSERKPFLLRLPPDLYSALSKWAADDLRSLNSQIEYLLRKAVYETSRSNSEQVRSKKVGRTAGT